MYHALVVQFLKNKICFFYINARHLICVYCVHMFFIVTNKAYMFSMLCQKFIISHEVVSYVGQ